MMDNKGTLESLEVGARFRFNDREYVKLWDGRVVTRNYNVGPLASCTVVESIPAVPLKPTKATFGSLNPGTAFWYRGDPYIKVYDELSVRKGSGLANKCFFDGDIVDLVPPPDPLLRVKVWYKDVKNNQRFWLHGLKWQKGVACERAFLAGTVAPSATIDPDIVVELDESR